MTLDDSMLGTDFPLSPSLGNRLPLLVSSTSLLSGSVHAQHSLIIMAQPDSPPPTPYDSFATSYDKIWHIPGIRPLLPLLTNTLGSRGPLEGAAVLDFACGTGIGLRVARSLGAAPSRRRGYLDADA